MVSKTLIFSSMVFGAASSQSDCLGNNATIGDGKCNSENNNLECNYDGGDCCMCDCLQGDDCEFVASKDCLNPSAEEEVFACEPPPSSIPCTVDVQTEWIVKNSLDALALAQAANCSGGIFNVVWEGHVLMEEPIRVTGGAMFNITGNEESSVMDGGNRTQVLASVDSTLYVSNMMFVNGLGVTGGGIAARNSVVTVKNTEFRHNLAIYGGGLGLIDVESSIQDVTFSNNNATVGGGIFAYKSMIDWDGNIDFIGNNASLNAGGAYVRDSELYSMGEVYCLENSAFYGGGGLLVVDSSVEIESCRFDQNHAPIGSSLITQDVKMRFNDEMVSENNTGTMWATMHLITSNITFLGDVSFINNTVNIPSGSVGTFNGADISTASGSAMGSSGCIIEFNGTTIVEGNSFSLDGAYTLGFGGGFYVKQSEMTFNGEVIFKDNGALRDFYAELFDTDIIGGALYVVESNLIFSNDTYFVGNKATSGGGAIGASNSSIAWGGGDVFFLHNSVIDIGGAIFSASSDLTWTGEAIFENNSAIEHAGGAIAMYDTDASFYGNSTDFIENHAAVFGGAIVMLDSSCRCFTRYDFDSTCSFIRNSALSDGGAIHLNNGSTFVASVTGGTLFSSNVAGGAGGAIGGSGIQPDMEETSVVALWKSVKFFNNSCADNGGAMFLTDGLEVSVPETSGYANISFDSNVAEQHGGAIYITGLSYGMTLNELKFTENVANIGGAVYVSSSGTRFVQDEDTEWPCGFVNCTFTSNSASISGGAIESSAGKDIFAESVFIGNVAPLGGAVRYAGDGNMDSCVFEDNVSLEGNGPSVDNIGSLVTSNSTFSNNVFDCKMGEYLEIMDGDGYETSCRGCGECDGCESEGIPVCVNSPDHSVSRGGLNTVEDLEIDVGYWRSSVTSLKILECPNDACTGGITGSMDYCEEGYGGYYCSVCTDGFSRGLGTNCEVCTENQGSIFLTVMVLVIVFGLAFFVKHLISGKDHTVSDDCTSSVRRHIPVQAIKIVITVWQIITQFSFVTDVVYPGVYQDFLDGVNFLNFDLAWITGCIFETDFHDKLLIATIGPVLALLCLALTFFIGRSLNHDSAESCGRVAKKHLSSVLFLTFLIYSSVSTILFQTFSCEEFEEGSSYLRADFRIDCDSKRHGNMENYASVMIGIYTVGIPGWYAYLMLNKDKNSSSARGLWDSYKSGRYYYELIECARRVLLTGVVVFIYPNTSAQIAITLMIAFVFFGISEALSPYASKWDKWVNRMGHVIVYTSMYVALLLKVDVSDESSESQEFFEIFLVVVNGVLILSIVVETVFMAMSMRRDPKESVAPLRIGIQN